LNGKKGEKRKQKDEEEEEKEILITHEEEKQIREVVSDINERAFYGKKQRKAPPKKEAIDAEMSGLSPRAREIAQVSKLITECKRFRYPNHHSF
jgi:hypothetical protein